MVNLIMNKELRIFDLTYLLSGISYSNRSKVAYVYSKLADYIDSDLIGIMRGENNCNLFSNVKDAETWLLEGNTGQSR